MRQSQNSGPKHTLMLGRYVQGRDIDRQDDGRGDHDRAVRDGCYFCPDHAGTGSLERSLSSVIG